MGRWYESISAMCPFYKGEGAHKLICEGVCRGGGIHMTFPSKKELDGHKEKYCYSWKYDECPLAKALDGFILKSGEDDGDKEPDRA